MARQKSQPEISLSAHGNKQLDGSPSPGSAGLPPGPSHPNAGQDPNAPKGWYSRGYLPHRDEIGLLQFITFRLADSLPEEKLRQLDSTLATLPDSDRPQARRRQIESWLDAGMGCCALRHPALAAVVEGAFLHGDGSRYRLLAWCIMPNHIHVLIRPQAPLGDIVRTWKSYTGRWALAHNAELELGVPGKTLWMREYWDRYIRNEAHLRATVDYIHQNPVKAGLCSTPTNWPWSSGRLAGSAGREPGAPGTGR